MRLPAIALAVLVSMPVVAQSTPLVDAAADGDVVQVKQLLEHGADPNERAENGATPLHKAIAAHHLDVAEELLNAAADIDAKHPGYYGATPLMLAAEHDDIDAGALLLRRGADVDAVDANHDTALNWAAYYGFTQFSKLLLDEGADPSIRGHGNALEIAMRRGHQPLVEMLARRMGVWHEPEGADAKLLAAVRSDDANGVKAAIEAGASPDLVDETVRPAVALAARLGKIQALAALIDAGATVDAEDSIGDTALMEAARERKDESVEILLAHGADAKHSAKPTGLSLTPLHMSAIGGSVAIVDRIAGAGAKIDARDSAGNTPLFWALVEQKKDALNRLLELGADPTIANDDGDSVASIAKAYAMDDLLARIDARTKP